MENVIANNPKNCLSFNMWYIKYYILKNQHYINFKDKSCAFGKWLINRNLNLKLLIILIKEIISHQVMITAIFVDHIDDEREQIIKTIDHKGIS